MTTPPRDVQVALQRLGLTANEIRCYTAALEQGPVSVPELARGVGLDRSNVYHAVASLTKHGLMSSSGTAYGKRIYAASPQKLLSLAADHRRRARRCELQIADLVPQLMSVYSTKGTRPRVQFYEGPEGIIRVFDDTLEDPTLPEILYCTSAKFTLFPEVEEYDRNYIERRKKMGIPIKILTRLNDWSRDWRKRDKEELRETRYVPPEYDFPSSLYVYGNKVSVISHDDEQVAIIIESEELSRMHRALFRYMWDNAQLLDPTTL